jgi:hypothetical protein
MNGTDLRDHLTRLAADVTAGPPSMPALRATADRRRVRHQRMAAGATVVLVAVAGVSVATVAGGGRHVVQTAASPAAAGLPGLVARGSVTLPAGLTPLQVERSGDLVWAVATNASSQPVVLHGRVGSTLTPLDLRSIDIAGSDVTIALTPTLAYVALTSGTSTVGHVRVPYLDERNAATGADEVGWFLDVALDPSRHGYDADGVALVPADDGAPTLAITSHSSGRQTLRMAVLDPAASPLRDLLSTEVTPPVAVPGARLVVSPSTPSFQGLTFVTTDHGLPMYAYLSGSLDTIPVLDLQTGTVGTYRTGSTLPESGGGLDAEAIGAVGGRVVFEVEGDDHDVHAQLAAPGALAAAATGPSGGAVQVEAGRIFRSQDTGTGADLQQLTSSALRATGPVAFMPDSGTLPTRGSYDVQAVGSDGRLEFFAAP